MNSMIIEPALMKTLSSKGYYEGRLSHWHSYVLGRSREEVMDLLFLALKSNG